MSTDITRRAALLTGVLAVAGVAALTGCDPIAGSTDGAPSADAPVVDVTRSRMIKQAAGLRPFRSSGFRVGTEQIGTKTVIHNYGHGGCGVTLSWGTAKMALDLAMQTPHRSAAVLGCGVAGLTTARLLQDHGFGVDIYAASLPPDTTSNVAAGVFGVTDVAEELSGPFLSQLQFAARYTHRYFQPFVRRDYGVKWFTLYVLGEAPIEQPPEFAITPELYPLTQFGPGEHPFSTPYAASLPTLIAETNVFIPRLMDDVVLAGGTVNVRSFATTDDLEALEQSLLINCTGLGARELFGDTELTPVRGQILFMPPQPELDYGYIDPKNDLYMFPRSDGVVFGGSHEIGESSTEPDPAVTTRILDGGARILAKK